MRSRSALARTAGLRSRPRGLGRTWPGAVTLARSVPKFTERGTASRLCRQAGRGRAGGPMKIIDGRVRVAASDVANFLACQELTQLDLRAARRTLRPPHPRDLGF